MATFRHHVAFGTRKQSKRTWAHSGHAGASGEDGIPVERGVTGMGPWPAPGDRQEPRGSITGSLDNMG